MQEWGPPCSLTCFKRVSPFEMLPAANLEVADLEGCLRTIMTSTWCLTSTTQTFRWTDEA